jgi:pyruvate/2-oxoglutarate dehydrogenase complex dihydrolipoamide dehydrogenase (E3) component
MISKALVSLLEKKLSNGLLVKLRQAYPSPFKIFASFQSLITKKNYLPNVNEKIIIVGLGPTAISLCKELKIEGYKNISIVTENLNFGGKCVNYGCMPIEYALTLQNVPIKKRSALTQKFVKDLKRSVEALFHSFRYSIIEAKALSVDGTRLLLSTNEHINFDRLILATGSKFEYFDSIFKTITIEQFWKIPYRSKLIIYSENNIAALSLADIGLMLGVKVTLLLAGHNPLEKIPSYKYFINELKKRGINIYFDVKKPKNIGKKIKFEDQNSQYILNYDFFLNTSKPKPNLISIDDISPTIYDIDLNSYSLPDRPDIHFLGDASGLFTVAESEVQIKMFINTWKHNTAPNYSIINRVPFWIHAQESLAIVGHEWNLFSSDWNELNFEELGWSRAHNLRGKLWYILNHDNGKIESIHICHKNAGELISQASLLLDFPVWDIKWTSNFIHPTSTEIFKLLAENALKLLNKTNIKNIAHDEPRRLRYKVPSFNEIKNKEFRDTWLNNEQYQQALISERPMVFFSVYFGLSKLNELLQRKNKKNITLDKTQFFLDDGTEIKLNPESRACFIISKAIVIEVTY